MKVINITGVFMDLKLVGLGKLDHHQVTDRDWLDIRQRFQL